MIKYYCDVCGKELTGWFHEIMYDSIQSPFGSRDREPRKTPLHFHEECLDKLFKYLAKEEDHEL